MKNTIFCKSIGEQYDILLVNEWKILHFVIKWVKNTIFCHVNMWKIRYFVSKISEKYDILLVKKWKIRYFVSKYVKNTIFVSKYVKNTIFC